VTVLFAFFVGLSVAGTPVQQRSLTADRTRVDNLHSIASTIKIWHDRAALTDTRAGIPRDLGILVREGDLQSSRVVDPVTRAPYEYHPKAGNRYELCAEFKASNIGEQSMPVPHSDFWRYGRGKTCFVLDAGETVPW
jgi:hypothetical protein